MKAFIALAVLLILAVICMAILVPPSMFETMFIGLVVGVLIAAFSCVIAG